MRKYSILSFKELTSSSYSLKFFSGTIRKSLQSRGSKMMTSLFHYFKTLDKSGDGLLSQDEIKKAFQKFRIQVSDRVRQLYCTIFNNQKNW